MSNEFDYTPPPECGHKAYKTESCAHCIYVVMQSEAKMYIYERDHAEAKLEHVTRVLANTQRALGEVLADRAAVMKERDGAEDLVIKQGEMLRAIADIVKGPPAELQMHSTHDVVECVQKLQDTKDALYQELNDLFTHKAQIEILLKHRDYLADKLRSLGDSWDRLYGEHAKAVQQRDKAEARAADLSRLLEAVLKNTELKEKTAALRKELELK